MKKAIITVLVIFTLSLLALSASRESHAIDAAASITDPGRLTVGQQYTVRYTVNTDQACTAQIRFSVGGGAKLISVTPDQGEANGQKLVVAGLDNVKKLTGSITFKVTTSAAVVISMTGDVSSISDFSNKELSTSRIASSTGSLTLSPVTNLSFGGRTEEAIRLNWKATSACEGYIIERQLADGSWKRIAKIRDNSEKTYKASGLSASTEYTFRVMTYAMNGTTGVYSDPVIITNKTRPSAVAGLVCGGRAVDAIRLNWTKNKSADGFIIERKLADGTWKRVMKVKDPAAATVKLSGLAACTAYKYRIRAYTMYGSEGLYGTYSYLDAVTKPAAVTGLKIGGTSTTAVRLNWTKNSKAMGYIIERQMPDGSWKRVIKISDPSVVTYKNDGLQPGTIYTFRISAYTMDGNTGVYSTSVKISGTTKPLQ